MLMWNYFRFDFGESYFRDTSVLELIAEATTVLISLGLWMTLISYAISIPLGIVMTGGGALIRGLDILLAQETGLPIHVDEDPLTCVVRGTGRILDDYEKYRSVLSV